MGLGGIESGGFHHITITLRRWATSSRHTCSRNQLRHNSSQQHKPPPPPKKAADAAGKASVDAAGSIPRHGGGKTVHAPRSPSQAIRDSAIGRVAGVYKRVQTRRPWVTQLVFTAVIYLVGDLNAQFLFSGDGKSETEGDADADGEVKVEEKEEEKGYDPQRTLRHLSIGLGASIPSYTWFMFVHNHFNFPSKVLSVAVKVLVQQVTFTPIFNTYFFGMQSLLAGATVADTLERLKKAVPTSVINSFKLWPAVSAFSFVYVGPEFRPLFFGIIAVGWQTYLSWLNQNAARQVRIEEDMAEAAPTPTHAHTHAHLPVVDAKTIISPGE